MFEFLSMEGERAVLMTLIEKYGTFGLRELGECGEERLAGYTGSGTNKQG